MPPKQQAVGKANRGGGAANGGKANNGKQNSCDSQNSSNGHNATNKKGGANGGDKKRSKADDEFDALLAEAVQATAKVASKQHANDGANTSSNNANRNGGAGAAHRSLADRDPVVASSADHPENPYRAAFVPSVASSTAYPRQTWPEPTVPVRAQFPAGEYPPGEICVHPGEVNASRHSSEEKRARERASEAQVQDLRLAAEVHRQVRTWAQSWIKPGIPLMLLTDRIEKKLNTLIEKDGLHRGQAFPTGCSINHVAAHYTPNSGDEKVVLQYDDVMKVDFGTQVNGHIVDCAWTVAFNPMYDPLLQAVKEATYEGIRQAGIDVRLCDIGAAIEEVMQSHEVEINGTVYPVRSIRNLSGHNIAPYIIHSGKSVPIVKGGADKDGGG